MADLMWARRVFDAGVFAKSTTADSQEPGGYKWCPALTRMQNEAEW